MEETLLSSAILGMIDADRLMHWYWQSDSLMALDDFGHMVAPVTAIQAQEEEEEKIEQFLLRKLFLEWLHLVSCYSRTQPISNDWWDSDADLGRPTVVVREFKARRDSEIIQSDLLCITSHKHHPASHTPSPTTRTRPETITALQRLSGGSKPSGCYRPLSWKSMQSLPWSCCSGHLHESFLQCGEVCGYSQLEAHQR